MAQSRRRSNEAAIERLQQNETFRKVLANLERALASLTPPALGAAVRPLAIGVSGGSDSRALLELTALLRDRLSLDLHCLTVDHGLRGASAAEAAAVARRCAVLGIPHATLQWEGTKPSANLAAAAREARYRLMRSWRVANSVSTLAVAHTSNDAAETFLLRLARGSGVDGLSLMAERIDEGEENGVTLTLIRPLLDVSREDLRAVCRAVGADWIEDPTNEDLRFDRPKARKALKALEPLGITTDRLVKTARQMRRAREALDLDTVKLLGQALEWNLALGWAALSVDSFRIAPREIALRAFAATLCTVAAAAYRPRLERLEAALDAILDDGSGVNRTLHGCVIERATPGIVAISREAAACEGAVSLKAGEERRWDGRFRVRVSRLGLIARALGEDGVVAIRRDQADEIDPAWAAAPRAARVATCAVYDGDEIVAAAGTGLSTEDVEIELTPQPQNFALGSMLQLIGNGQRLS